MSAPYILGGLLTGAGRGIDSLMALRQAEQERQDRIAAQKVDDERAAAWLALQTASMEDARKTRERTEGMEAERERYRRYQDQKTNRREEREQGRRERETASENALREAQTRRAGRRTRTVEDWRGIVRKRMQELLPRDAAGDRETQARVLAQVRTEYPDAPGEVWTAFEPALPTAPAITVTRRAGTPAESTQASGRRTVSRAEYDAMVQRYGQEQTDRHFQPR